MSKQFDRLAAFDLAGSWWHRDGDARVEAMRPKEGKRLGLDQGLALAADCGKPVLGTSAQQPARGRLHFEPHKAARLHLDDAAAQVFANQTGFVMHGIDEEGIRCTLLDCFSGPPAGRLVEVVAHQLIRGGHFGSLDELLTSEITIVLEGLDDFITEVAPRADGTPTACNLNREGGELTVDLGAAQLVLTVAPEAQASPTGRASATFRFGKPVPHATATADWVLQLQTFIRFATGRSARMRSVSATVRAAPADDVAIELLAPVSGLLRGEDERQPRTALLSLGALGDQLDAVLRRWWELSRLVGPAGNLLFAAINNRGFMDAQLMTLASVSEAYHRATDSSAPVSRTDHEGHVQRMLEALEDEGLRTHYRMRLSHADGYSQRDRLKLLIRQAGRAIPEMNVKGGRLAQRISDTRDVLVHLPSSPDTKPLTDRDLIEANALLILVLECNLLLDLGLGDEHVAALVAYAYNSNLMWGRLRRRGHAWPRGH